MIVLGIDPGISNTGFGVVERRGSLMQALDGGVIVTSPDTPLELRLAEIGERVEALIDRYAPDAMAVESIFFGKNAQSAFLVGQARGVVVHAAGRRQTPVTSYTPQQIKLAVCGSGGADKLQVQKMVCTLLSISGPLPPDHAADALAVGVCHTNGTPLTAAIDAAGTVTTSRAGATATTTAVSR